VKRSSHKPQSRIKSKRKHAGTPKREACQKRNKGRKLN
jgi:hypothetical protein